MWTLQPFHESETPLPRVSSFFLFVSYLMSFFRIASSTPEKQEHDDQCQQAQQRNANSRPGNQTNKTMRLIGYRFT
jgi:hypothetical protein